MIERRLVFQVAGYDPVDAEGHHRRFVRGVPIFERTWNVSAAVSDVSAETPRYWTVTTQAPNWRVDTIYQPLVWDDIIRRDYAVPILRKLGRFMLALYDIFATGTVFRYFRANFQYGFFFLFPVVYLIAFAAAGWWLGRSIAGLLWLDGFAHALAVATIAAAVFFGLLQWPGRRWRVLQALDDWIFSWDFLHGRRPDMETRLDRFARQLIEAANDKGFDEIILCGHSLGATMAVATAARALALDPALGTRGPTVCVMTVGSTIPKFSLHPDAGRIRSDIERLAAPGAVEWAEFHARADPISFYKFDPVTGERVGDRFDRKPIIRMVRIRGMLDAETYRRLRFRFMRIHHQFVMANGLRNAYDFYMMGCGPIPFMKSVMTMEGPAAMIGPDGALTVQPAENAAR